MPTKGTKPPEVHRQQSTDAGVRKHTVCGGLESACAMAAVPKEFLKLVVCNEFFPRQLRFDLIFSPVLNEPARDFDDHESVRLTCGNERYTPRHQSVARDQTLDGARSYASEARVLYPLRRIHIGPCDRDVRAMEALSKSRSPQSRKLQASHCRRSSLQQPSPSTLGIVPG